MNVVYKKLVTFKKKWFSKLHQRITYVCCYEYLNYFVSYSYMIFNKTISFDKCRFFEIRKDQNRTKDVYHNK